MAKRLMIQGTMSGVGKSLITAGLLRVLSRDGYRVAPFKSQNMALNSFVTREGLEIGRAQAFQAEAAGIEPSVSMNPILLKPDSDTGSQVIVNGEIYADLSAREYFAEKRKLVPVILEAYEHLAAENEILIIEGAGSPAEINLRADDIVNMGLAELINAPVLLVGDIDRGGVFAQLYGTVALLSAAERARVRGLLINKFRGDVTLLAPGLSELSALCEKPVLGVLPYRAFGFEEEDSLTDRFSVRTDGELVMRVVRLPHISNFTDFDCFLSEPQVGFAYAARPEELTNADVILLPGTKNTVADFRWLRESGFAEEILRRERAGAVIVGICGGYQMLGEKIGGEAGLSLLPVKTTFAEQKTRTQRSGALGALNGFFSPLSGKPYRGYEIHMGVTAPEADVTEREKVLGTYLHGIFDEDAFRAAFLSLALKEKGISYQERDAAALKKERKAKFALLEETIRKHIDMEQVYRILEEQE